ncbi:hypothetical protein OBBRIDRAFT_815662 [Obba rivulosa]|uniref:Ubiquitin-like protease family profile domain-containing protein n=1 Tax=Obba rivulosa TaxID=1052685 RepID=A0A8E2DIN0_9APHY|nr:hypothetical protein OBBRIDRAFT_815662 [Obba rivulosa]
MYERWKKLLPEIVEPLLGYLQQSAGNPVASRFVPIHSCNTPECVQKTHDVTILFWDPSGMFPTSPTLPRIAVSVDLLEFYFAIFERSGDAITALARALRNYYTRRGWRVLDSANQGTPMLDPFRKPLGYAVQWYDNVRVLIDRTVDHAIDNARATIAAHLQSNMSAPVSRDPTDGHPLVVVDGPMTQPATSSDTTGSSATTSHTTESSTPSPPSKPKSDDDSTSGSRRECASFLQHRCPACFGGAEWGRPFAEGGDIVVAIDGNFSHRHLRSAGDSPAFYDPDYFIPKEKVDAVGARIEALCKTPSNRRYVPKVPDEAVDACEQGHTAADEQKAKTNGDRFDDTGIMALVCTHDIPIFLINIDTPGEQLKYSMCMLEELFSHIPDNATVAALYDIGCVADRGNGLYSYLPDHITTRLLWAISVMHAYGHQWACQLVYNPRLRPGLGLRDGEGVERLWSKLRVFIPITRTSGRARRIWLIDRQARVIGDEMRNSLGIFIIHKLKHGVRLQRANAQNILSEIAVSETELRRQWSLQQEAQLSIRAHAPARLKKEVDAVLVLQGDIDRVETAIKAVRAQLQASGSSSQSINVLGQLENGLEELGNRVESLYTSLNVSDVFPELKGLNVDFVKMLVLARDVKVNLRKRVTAQFLEYDRLDRAAGGKDNPLGTKLHQHTRKAISKRQPSILTAIRKFNKYCMILADAASKPGIPASIVLPQPLATDLAKLRDDPNLYEDVWITPNPSQEPPRWLEDQDVRNGIQALLKMDRCKEEEARLRREADNMTRWFGRELAATQLAMSTFGDALYAPLLQQRHDDVALLQRRWDMELLPSGRLASRVQWAEHTVREILDATETRGPALNCATVVSLHLTSLEDDDSLSDDEGEDGLSAEDVDNPEMVDLLEDVTYADAEMAEAQDTMSNTTGGNGPETMIDTDMSDDGVLAVWDASTVQERAASPSQNCGPRISIQFHWICPAGLRQDDFTDLDMAQFIRHASHILAPRVLPRASSSNPIQFNPEDFTRIAADNQMLNCDCINACAALLQHTLARNDRSRCAVFSTYDINCAANNDDGGALWRSIRHRYYWERDVWLIPVHREGMGDQTSRVQNNGIDCGVWVLAVMAAHLRGFDMIALQEGDLRLFRAYLCTLISQLPERT